MTAWLSGRFSQLVPSRSIRYGMASSRIQIGIRQEHLVAVVAFHLAADLLDDRVALRQVLAVGPLALDQVRDGVEPHPDRNPPGASCRGSGVPSRGGPS